MNAAVAQLTVVQVGFLAALAGQFGNAGHRLALALALRHLLQYDIGHIGILVQIVVHLLLHEVADELVYADAAFRSSRQRAQLNLRLALKHRLLDVDADGCYQSVADVHILVVLSAVILDDLGNIFLEGCLVSAAQRSVLPVYKAVIFLAVLAAVRKGYLYVFASQMYDIVEGTGRHSILKQVRESVATQDAPSVEHDGQACIQVSIVAQHHLHELVLEGVMLKQGGIGLEIDECAVLVLSILSNVGLQDALLEGGSPHLSVAV